MKTFIWNREYEVLAVNANTLEEAIEILKPQLDALLDPKLDEVINDSIQYLKKHPSAEGMEPGWYRDSGWWARNIQYVKESIEEDKKILNKHPDVIIEENQAIIFNHTNE